MAIRFDEPARTPFVLGTAEAYPRYTHTQEEFLEAYLRQLSADDHEARDFARRVFPATQIENGSSPLPKDRLFTKMRRAEFVSYVREAVQDMSMRACTSALQSWGGDLQDITHLVFGTMSAVIDAPTMDCRLINLLGLPDTVRRVSVQQMGCLTGFRCLSTACELAAANPKARVLVVVADVRSGLQNQLSDQLSKVGGVQRVTTISCALFRDAASACVVGCQPREGSEAPPLARVLAQQSLFVKNTLEHVVIKDGDDATISWYNDKELPYVVSANVPRLAKDLAQAARLPVASSGPAPAAGAALEEGAAEAQLDWEATDVQFAMHPGGPKILQLAQERMGNLPDSRFQVSWEFLKQHGNTSGSSNLALLHMELQHGLQAPAAARKHIMCIGIGPGLSLEGLLLERMPRPAAAEPVPATVGADIPAPAFAGLVEEEAEFLDAADLLRSSGSCSFAARRLSHAGLSGSQVFVVQ